MDLRGNTERLESSLDILIRRLDQDRLPPEPGEPTARGQERPAVGDGARHEVSQVLAFQREQVLHAHSRCSRRSSARPSAPPNPVRVVHMEGKRLPLPRVHQHDGLGDARAANDVVPVAHHSQPAGTRGNETCILMDHDQHLEPFNGYCDVRVLGAPPPRVRRSCVSRCYPSCARSFGISPRQATRSATSLRRAATHASACASP